MKKNLYKTHKYAGLTLGFLIFILAITGVGLTFREELMPKLYPELFRISGGEETLPVSELYQRGLADLGQDHTFTNLYTSAEPQEAWIFIAKEERSLFPTMLTVNPYTGEIVGKMSMIKNVFAVMLFLHTNLMLGKIGSYFVGLLGFLVVLFVGSGIYLWCPKSKAKEKFYKTIRSFRTIQGSHHSLGLLFGIPLLVSGLTGLLIVYDLSYHVMRPMKQEAPRIDELERKGACSTEDQLKVLSGLPLETQAKLISIHFCTQKSNLMKVSSGLRSRDFLEGYERTIIDPGKKRILQTFNSETDPKSWNIKRLFIYPLHTGELFGILGRSLNLVTGIGLSGLVITGYLLSHGRRLRARRRRTDTTESECSLSRSSETEHSSLQHGHS